MDYDGTELRTVPATVEEEQASEVAGVREVVPEAPEHVNELVHPGGPFETMEDLTRYLRAIPECLASYGGRRTWSTGALYPVRSLCSASDPDLGVGGSDGIDVATRLRHYTS